MMTLSDKELSQSGLVSYIRQSRPAHKGVDRHGAIEQQLQNM